MKEILEFSGLVISVLTPVIGGIWFLLSVYYNQEKELNRQKQGLTEESIKKLEILVDDVDKSISLHKVTIAELSTKLTYAVNEMVSLKVTLSKLSDSTDEFIKSSEKRLIKVETQIEQIGKNLYKVKG